jgi:tetratricopeptide (TPR) repeat protein
VIVADPLVDDLRTLVRGERLLVIHGRRAYEAGQFQEAAALLRRAVEAAPDSVPARLTLGLSLAQLGDGDGALVHLRAAFARAPGDGAVGGALIGARVRFERADEAIAVRTAVPDDEQPLLGLVLLLAHRARYREAVALLEDGYRRFPERVLTATTLARLLSSSPDPQVRDGRRALELATAVYAVSTTGADAETVALALAEAGRCGEALDWIRRAVAQSRTAGDGAETARLTAEVPRYEARDCRAPAP